MVQTLAGGGELGALIREKDWSKTALGPIQTWSQSLKTAVSLILNSQHPMWIGWGEDMTFLYNDAYIPVLSLAKHPWALGCPAEEVWSEIWDYCGPLAEKVFNAGEATFAEDMQLFMSRGDFIEETYYSFSYSPIRDETGKVAGLFCPSAETTSKVRGARRLRTLSELGANALAQKSVKAACASAMDTIAKNSNDIPFSLLYVLEPETTRLRLVHTTGAVHAPNDDYPAFISIEERSTGGWDLGEIMASGLSRVVDFSTFSDVPLGLADQRVASGLILPLITNGDESPVGVLIAAVNPAARLDDEYRAFFDLIAAQITTGILHAASLEEERRRADTLAELDRAKTAFFSNVSHEFRTPLTLLIGPTEDALASPEKALSGEALEVVYRNELRLMKLVNALLEFSRIEAGRVHANYIPLDLAQATRELAGVFETAVRRAGLEFVVDCPPLPEQVFVDREMWEKIVLNLLSNALKFTFEGRIEVRLKVVAGRAELTVSDTGVGVAEHEIPRLFERFHRVEGARARTHEGSGIGLALVQELTRLQNGYVDVTSRLGEGTTFRVSLPFGDKHVAPPYEDSSRVPSSSERPPPSQLASAVISEALRWTADAVPVERESLIERKSDLGQAHILVVDDNADMREYVARLLREHWDVETAVDGADALRRLRTESFDVVLSDVMMPNVDGFGLIKELRQIPERAHVPVILLSARAGEEASVEGLRAGADDYLIKPFSARELVARVRARLEIARARSEAEQSRERLEAYFMQAPVPVSILTGPELRYELANPEYRRGFGDRDVVGKPFLEVFPELADAPAYAMLQGVLATGQTFRADEYHVRLDRNGTGQLEDLYYQLTCQPMLRADGQVDGVMSVSIEVTEQVLARREIERQRERLSDIVESLPVGLSLTSASGERHTNSALRRLWGAEANDPNADREKINYAAYHSDGRPYLPEDWPHRRVLRNAEAVHVDALRFSRFDGSEGWMRVDAVPLFDSGTKNVREALVASVDVSAQKFIESELEQARQDAESANRSKDEFMAMLGHELRNPLAPITTALRLLHSRGRNDKELDVIARQVTHLTRLVDDLLDVSRITAGKVELRQQRVSLESVVTQAIETSSPVFEQRRQNIVIQTIDEVFVEGDLDRLAQVFSNLLMNASKYSETGTQIELFLEKDGATARFRVVDHGIGIEQEKLHRVFDLFYQQPQALDRAKGGLGLGLAIAQSLIRQHGGTISVRSEGPGRGSEFIVELVAVDSEPRETPSEAPPSSWARRRGEGRILVVDDNEDAADLLAEFLTARGFEVEVAYDAFAALEAFPEFAPSACLLDLGLPVMDGFELAGKLRHLAGDGALRLVAVTGYGQSSDRSRAEDAGFDAHVVKPVNLDQLLEVIAG